MKESFNQGAGGRGGLPPRVPPGPARPAAPHHERFGYTTPIDLYAVESYPEADFQNEPEMQRVVTLRRKAIDRWLMVGFFAGAAALFASLLLGVIGQPVIILVGLGVVVVLFILLALLGSYDPALDCPRCSRRLKPDWVVFESGRSGKFWICPVCRIYVYTHRTLR